MGGRGAGRRRPGRGSGRRGGNGAAANQRAAHQLTAFAYTRCTPAARSTKRGAPRAPAASLGASEAVRRARTALGVWRGTGGVSPGVGILAVASLAAPGAFLWTWPHAAPPSAPHLPYPPSQPCLPLPRSPRAGPSPGRRSSCCSCRRLASCRGPLPGPQGAPARCGLGGRLRSAGPPLPAAAAAGAGRCAPRHPRRPGLGVSALVQPGGGRGVWAAGRGSRGPNLAAWRDQEGLGNRGAYCGPEGSKGARLVELRKRRSRGNGNPVTPLVPPTPRTCKTHTGWGSDSSQRRPDRNSKRRPAGWISGTDAGEGEAGDPELGGLLGCELGRQPDWRKARKEGPGSGEEDRARVKEGGWWWEENG